MREVRLVAQAKINLFLRVLARETSGYHALETLFQRLEVGDDVVVRVDVPGRTLDCRGANVGPVERNLAWRAATAYAEATGWPGGWAIEIEKRIPVGGGLGGGSADAGAVLRALNALAPAPLPQDALLALAARLGADVPFLTTEAPLALAWGRGERMLALPALPTRPVLLLCPDVGVSTADAFRWLADDRGAHPSVPRLLDVQALASWEGVARLAGNDFEAPVARRLPALQRWLAPASPGDAIRALTGSGSTVFWLSTGNGAVPPEGWPAASTSADQDGQEAGARVVATSTAVHVVPVTRIE